MEKQVMVVGIDDSEHSMYCLQWTIDHFFPANSPFKLVLVHAKPCATSAVGLAGPGAADVLPFVEADLNKIVLDYLWLKAIKRIAGRVVEAAKGACANKVSDVLAEVRDGDARNVLCEAVEKHQASVLVVGSHGYGAIKRAVLGSVSDYCTHHAHCSVMIVKKPKTKH